MSRPARHDDTGEIIQVKAPHWVWKYVLPTILGAMLGGGTIWGTATYHRQGEVVDSLRTPPDKDGETKPYLQAIWSNMSDLKTAAASRDARVASIEKGLDERLTKAEYEANRQATGERLSRIEKNLDDMNGKLDAILQRLPQTR